LKKVLEMKRIVRELTPPLLWRLLPRRTARGGSAGRGDKWAFGAEQPAAYYDETFEATEHWKRHYTASRYYPVWTVVADRIRRRGVRRVVDIGCGPGQVACLMRDAGIEHYTGLDFSGARIAHAKMVCPGFDFIEADIFGSDILATAAYDSVLIMEFLEHVEEDLSVLRRLRPGTHVLATVPNFPSAGHVRHFRDTDEVGRRYASTIGELRVDAIPENAAGKTYFLLEGLALGEGSA
jgi:trans-aconitate methyltransferase